MRRKDRDDHARKQVGEFIKAQFQAMSSGSGTGKDCGMMIFNAEVQLNI